MTSLVSMRVSRSRLAMIAVGVLGCGLTASAAQASTISVTGSAPARELHFVGGPGEANGLVLWQWDDGRFGLMDSAPLTYGPGCHAPTDQFAAYCDPADRVRIDFGDGNDGLTAYGLSKPATVLGGDGDDALAGSSVGDVLNGEAGNDSVGDSGGDDRLSGGPGDDTFLDLAVAGADRYEGGTGVDSLSYFAHNGVTASIGGAGIDHETGVTDSIGADFENLSGSLGADTLTGTDGPNVFDDGGGNPDTVIALGGDDRIELTSFRFEGAQGDVVEAGPGNDAVSAYHGVVEGRWNGGPGDDAFSAGGAGNWGTTTIFDGGDGTDSFQAGWILPAQDGVSITLDGAANDGPHVIGTANVLPTIENVIGTPRADVLIGSGADNRIDGGWGADDIRGGAGRDTVTYNDHRSVTVSLDGVAGDGGEDSGRPENDNIAPDVEDVVGTDGDDTLIGSPQANRLVGLAGNDAVRGGSGDDLLDAGAGRDTVDYADHTQSVTIDLQAPGDAGQAGEHDRLLAFEDIVGGGGDDVLIGDALDNRLDGGPGADRMRGAGGRDVVDYSRRTADVSVEIGGPADNGEAGEHDTVAADVEDVLGGAGDDWLQGDEADNQLDGGAGDDALAGGTGPDTLRGGPGFDLASYEGREAPVHADLDADARDDGELGEGDTILAAEGLIGGNGADVLTGADGSDYLDGAGGPDAVNGAGGDDELFGGPGPDRLLGGDGSDQIDAGAEDDQVDAGHSADAAYGGSGVDTLAGGDGDDFLDGGEHDDTLRGDAGTDVLDGGTGSDRVSGGAGLDLADYSLRSAPIVATLGATGGEQTEHDELALDVEGLAGGTGPDVLRGSDAQNGLFGGPGDDRLDPGTGSDIADGESGDDRLDLRDEIPDAGVCGEGSDHAVVDVDDLVDPDCERVDFPSASGESPFDPTPPGVPTPPIATPADTLAPKITWRLAPGTRSQQLLTRGLTVRARCSETCVLRLELRLDASDARRAGITKRRKAVVIGTVTRRLPAARDMKVTVPVKRALRTRLRRLRVIHGQLVATATDAAHNTATTARTVRIRR